MTPDRSNRAALAVAALMLFAPAAAMAQPKPPANPAAQATLLGQYGD